MRFLQKHKNKFIIIGGIVLLLLLFRVDEVPTLRALISSIADDVPTLWAWMSGTAQEPTMSTFTINNAFAVLLYIAGIVGIFYFCGAGLLWGFYRIRFDQLLVSGNFLTKVIRLVLFFPFALTLVSIWILGNNPKKLTYYEEGDDAPYISISCDSQIDVYDIAEGEPLEQEHPNIFWSTLFHMLDPGNQDMTTGNGRLWGSIIAICGMVLLNGLLVSSLIGYFDKRKEQWLKGAARYNGFLHYYPHHIVVGGNDMALGIIKQLLDEKGYVPLSIRSFIGFLKEYLHYKLQYVFQTSQNGKAESQNGKNTGTDHKQAINSFGKLLREFLYRKKPYILVQTSQDVEKFRQRLFSTLTEEEKKWIVIYYGNRTSPEDIADLQLESTKKIYILGEETRTDDIESHHDTINMECMELILKAFEKTKRGEALTRLTPRIKEISIQIKEKEKAIKDKENANKEVEGCKKDVEILKAEKKAIEEYKLECRIMFEYQTTFSVFQFYDIDNITSSYINFKPFNYYEMWAQKVLINREIDKEKLKSAALNGDCLPLEGVDGIKKDSDKYVHLFIVGMSRMGIAMAVEAAHLAHYPNYVTKNIRTKITFIDKNAAEEKEFFMGRLKSLFDLSHWRYGNIDREGWLVWEKKHEPTGYEYLGGDFLDIEWEFINGGIEVPAVQDYMLYSATPQAKVTIAICLPESSRSHAAAMYLSRGIYESDSVQQILVYNRYGSAIIDAIIKSGKIYPYCGKFKSFGHAAECFVEKNILTSEKIGEKIDAKYDDINNEIKKKKEEEEEKEKEKKEKTATPKEETIAENTNAKDTKPNESPDKEAPKKYKGKSSVANTWSSIYNGNTLWTKLRCRGCEKDEPTQGTTINEDDIKLLADVEHNRWNIEELIMNFIPLTEKEQKEIIEHDNDKKKEEKDKLKGNMRHLDICSNKRLLEIDKETRAFDEGLTKVIPNIYEDLEKELKGEIK